MLILHDFYNFEDEGLARGKQKQLRKGCQPYISEVGIRLCVCVRALHCALLEKPKMITR